MRLPAYLGVWRIVDQLVNKNSLALLIVRLSNIVDSIKCRVWHVRVEGMFGAELLQLAIGLHFRNVLDGRRVVIFVSVGILGGDLGNGRLTAGVDVGQLGLCGDADDFAIAFMVGGGKLAGRVSPLEAEPLERILGTARHVAQRMPAGEGGMEPEAGRV